MPAADLGAAGGWMGGFHLPGERYPDRDVAKRRDPLRLDRAEYGFLRYIGEQRQRSGSLSGDETFVATGVSLHRLFKRSSKNLIVSLDRLRGYRQAMFEAGLPIDEKRITEADFSEEGGFRALVRMRKAGIFFDAGVPCALPSMKHWRFRMNWASSDLTIRR